jgi:hypothetical protein
MRPLAEALATDVGRKVYNSRFDHGRDGDATGRLPDSLAAPAAVTPE